MITRLWKYNKSSLVLILTCAILYYSFAYTTLRTDFVKVFSLWGALFFLSYKIFQLHKGDYKLLAFTALLFRVIFLFATPNLSQDFYRFIWDGRMLLEGMNPYLSLPETWIKAGNSPVAQAIELYQGMGPLNGSHFTNYPPISQLAYAIAALLSPNSILGAAIVFRLILISADIGIFFIGRKLLKKLHLQENRIFWYILNPFIIIELTGNLHFEALMIFFIVWSLYLIVQNKWFWAGIVLALSVSVKLIPLLFLPLFFQKYFFSEKKRLFGFLKLCGFYSVVLISTLLLFIPFLSKTFIQNFSTTIALWFQNFEFNASIYYIIRWIGYQTIGWNIIATAGKILPLVFLCLLLILSFFRKNKETIPLITAMLISISVYYFLSTTVHPWYIAVPLFLCIFTPYRFPIVWSFLIILSYTAYTDLGFKENLWMVAIEYILVISVFVYESFISSSVFFKPKATN
ncbi:glycosyltransferase 87 family protein [Aquimarina hainanensis]|uniref:Glycosyltransferase 87 family protein n=1 Tax=Aquimarina hainanensis TaxID=1578017 RepID=A0ABW5N5W9_9FLAO